MRAAVASPVSMSIAVCAGCIGLGFAGVLGALVATLAVVVLAAHTARYALVRRYLDHQAWLRERMQRDQARLLLLRPSGAVRVAHYTELRALVEEIEQIDGAEAARFELQDLLDHWVRLAVSLQKCTNSLRMAGAAALPSVAICDSVRSSRRRDILQRRIRHRDECKRRMEQITDELDAVDELIRLIAQRTACPALDGELDREIDRRLWELDEVDAALHQLSA
jgi:hypothetical protein